MNVDEARKVCQDRSVWFPDVSGYPARRRDVRMRMDLTSLHALRKHATNLSTRQLKSNNFGRKNSICHRARLSASCSTNFGKLRQLSPLVGCTPADCEACSQLRETQRFKT